MSNENNKMQVDIENLFKQNVNDLSAIKELYRKLKEVEEKILQIKYIDSKLANKLKKEYEKLKRIILDENVQAKLANDIETLNENLTNEIETINSQLDTKANRDFYEVVFKNTSPLEIDTEKLQEAIESGVKYIKFPSNCKAKMEQTIYLLNHCKIYGENTTLYKDNPDSPFFSNVIPSGGTRLEGVEINKITFEKKTGSAYHIHLVEPYKCKVYKCNIIGLPNSQDGFATFNKSGVFFEKKNSTTCFVNYIEKCFINKASIYMMGTDSYIRNNVIWGYTQEEAIRLKSCSNIDISNNQIVGGSVNGAIYSDVTGSACGVSRIVNNFFDGSYDEIASGIGLNGYFTLCDISKNTFYNQSKSGIKLYNPNGNTIEGNTFTQNNKDGDGIADILIEYEGNTSFMNSFNNNTFNNTRNNGNYLCIKEVVKNGSPTRYNHMLDNITPIGATYTDFFEGKSSGVIDNNQFRSKLVTNKTKIDKTYGSLNSTYENVTINYNISSGCCSIYINVASGNLTIPAGGSITLSKVIAELCPRYEVNETVCEHNKISKLRATLTADGDLKINNWNASSEGEQVVSNMRVTLTYALK